MSEFGMMGVDWEERVNFDRLRRERLKKAQAPWLAQRRRQPTSSIA